MIAFDLSIRVALMLLMAFGPGVWCCCTSAKAASVVTGCGIEAAMPAPQPGSSPCAGGSNCRMSAASKQAEPDAPQSSQPPAPRPCGCSKLTPTAPERSVPIQSSTASDQLVAPLVELSIDAPAAEVELTWPLGWKPPEPPGLIDILSLHCQFLN